MRETNEKEITVKAEEEKMKEPGNERRLKKGVFLRGPVNVRKEN